MARLFLIDHHAAVRQGLALLLQGKHTICGEAGSRGEAVEQLVTSCADLVLLDLVLGPENGFELIASARRLGINVLVYSLCEDAESISGAFAVGAGGYVTKCEPADALLAAVTDLLAGKRHISPRAAQSLANRTLSACKNNKI